MSFEARDLTIKLSSAEPGVLWAMPCGACDSTAAAPKPACLPPSAPCNSPSLPCAAPSKKAEAFDFHAAGLLVLRQQLQSVLAPDV